MPAKDGFTGFFRTEFDEHLEVLQKFGSDLFLSLDRVVAIWAEALRNGGKLLFFGNGGSAADAQHLAAELTVRYRRDRTPIAALALAADAAGLTAAGNDLGFERVFARQIEALGKPGDVAVGITTSGRSPNVLEGLRSARRMGLVAMAISGGDGGALPGLAEPLILAPSQTTARIQEMHILLGHMLCGAVEIELGLVNSP